VDEEAARNPKVKLEGLAGVILAAGYSSRMGKDKALLELPGSGKNFISAQIASLKPHCELVIVIAGANVDAIKDFVFAEAAELLANPDPARGQFSSLRVGLQAVLDRGRDKALITHVDRIPCSSQTIEGLKSRFAEAHGEWLVVPEYEGQHGHPVLAGREMIEAWLQAPIESTAREIEHAHQQRIEYLRVNDPSVVANINTPDDYERLKG
jgi:molybdenum cofactor cytidylyltransferase